MKKIKTTKITEKFDENGNLVERITEETSEEKDEPITINSPLQNPVYPPSSVWYNTTQNTNDNITVSNRSEEE